MATQTRIIGPISAYAIAVDNGYTGTEAEFAQEIANASANAQLAQEAADTVQALVPEDYAELVSDVNGLAKEIDYQNWLNGYHFISGKNIVNINDTPNIKEDAYYSGRALNAINNYNSIAIELDTTQSVLSCNHGDVYINFFSEYEVGKLSQEVPPVSILNYISNVILSTSDTAAWDNISIPENAKWIIVSAKDNVWNNLQIEYAAAHTDYEPYSIVMNPSIELYNGEKTVSVMDYTNLRVCLQSISPSKKNPYVVEIPDGTYDIKSYYTAEEIADSSFHGLFVPDYVTLRGVGSRENTILKWENASDDINNAISTLNIYNVAGLENLTVVGTNIRYAVHDDFATPYDQENIRIVKNCIFQKSNAGYKSAYGAGIKGNAQWLFENCVFDATGSQMRGFAVHNSRNSARDSNITLINCRFINSVVSSCEIEIASMNNNVTGITYVNLFGCSFNNSSKIALNESNAAQYGAGIKACLRGFGNTFTNDDVTITVSDGNDYSDCVNLIFLQRAETATSAETLTFLGLN